MHADGGARRGTWAVVTLAGASLVVVVAALLWPTAEDRVRQVILTAAEDAQARRVDDVMALVHPAFKGPREVNRERSRQVLAQSFAAYAELSIEVKELAVDINADETGARAQFTVGMRGRMAPDAPWDDIVARWKIGSRWDAALRYDDEGWRVIELRATREGE